MSTFGKIGDQVRNKLPHLYSNSSNKIVDNNVFKNGSDNDTINVQNDKGSVANWSIKNIEFVNKGKSMQNENTEYSFGSSCVHDINWKLIISDLTKAKPIALITVPIEGAVEKRAAFIKMSKTAEKLSYRKACKEADEAGKDKPEKIDVPIPDMPIATHYIALHASLREKAMLCNISLPNPQHDIKVSVFKISENFSVWIAWAKKVKSAPWPKDIRNHATVDIQQIVL